MIFIENKRTIEIDTKLYFRKKEESFDTEPANCGDFTIMIGVHYLGIDISLDTMEVISIRGYCDRASWINDNNMRLNKQTKKCAIKVKPSESEDWWFRGAATDLLENIPIYFNKNTNWVCIGTTNNEQYDTCIEFINNCIMCLSNGEFRALWLNPEFI